MQPVTFTPIGVVRSPFTSEEGMPIQSIAAEGVEGRIELDPAFAPGLADLEGFSHLWMLTHLHRSWGQALVVTPFLDDQPHGVFATRSPRRPNPIGLSLIRLQRIEGHVLHVVDLDVIDGTPVLDLKPYVPVFDARETTHIGWYEGKLRRVKDARSDARFKH